MNHYIGTASVIALTAVLAGAARAQTPVRPPASSDATTVDEVVVTARRRNEQLRDVPAAVTSITAEQRDALVLDGMQDYVRQIPSATLVNSGPEYLNDFSLRGQGGGRLGFSETSTGVFKDGAYSAGGGFGGRSLNRLDLFDIERLEVLRGPQGALYGRNSVGGALNVIAVKPRPEPGFAGELGYQDTDRTSLEAIVNIPFGDRFGLRAGGFIDDQTEGHHLNTSTGNFVDRQRFAGARVTGDFRPARDQLLRLVYEYYDSTTPAFGNIGYRSTAPANVGGFAIDPDPYTRAFMNREGYGEIEEHSLFLTGEFATRFGDLTVKVNRREREAIRSGEDLDHFLGLPSLVLNGQTVDLTSPQAEDFVRTGFDVYLASAGEGRISWLFGVEGQFFDDKVMLDPACPAYAATGPATLVAGCNTGGGTTALPDFSPTGTPLTAGQAGAALAQSRLNLNHDEFQEEIESVSLYGSVDYDLSDAVTLGFEARVQRDTKDFIFRRWSEDPIAYYGAGTPPAGRLAEVVVNGQPAQFCPPEISGAPACVADGGVSRDTLVVTADEQWTRYTPAATIKYDVTGRDTIYARFATGYRPGGFNNTIPAGLSRADFDAVISYEPEYAYSYEAGWKGRLFGNIIIDAAVFYTQTNESQVVTSISALSRGFILQNAGDTHVYGVELDLRGRWSVGPGRLFASLTASSLDGEFEDGATALLDTNGDGAPDPVDLAGNQVPRLRDYQVSLSAGYSVPLFADVQGVVSASLQSADGGFQDSANTETYEGYTLFDARIGLQTERWRLSVFGRNLGDERYRLQTFSANSYFNEPRIIGVELGVRY